MNMPPISFFARKGLLLIKPPKPLGRIDAVHREYGLPFIFRNRLEGQRAYDKQTEINALFTAKHLAHFLVKGLEPKFSLDVPSQSPGHPVKISVERTDDEHIAISVNVRKDGKQLEASVETSLADFKLMQILFENAIPKMLGWDGSLNDKAEIPFAKPSEQFDELKQPKKSKSLAEDFFGSS